MIVYAPTITRVDETVDFLEEHGIAAIPYHGKMDAGARRRNQERWMSDEVRVLVGTVAFGLGINKAAVRAVLHLALPKSIEQFYQEAGRAGRDGQPADCVLLWQKRDAGLLAFFAGQLTDPAEKESAFQRYDEIRKFAESKNCRHRQICAHFGENVKWKSCGACDSCGCELAWLSKPIEPPRIVATFSRSGGKVTPPRATVAPPGIDIDLREYLREWRRTAAKQQAVPAFVVMHDTTLDELCRARPTSLAAIRRVPGFGERKTELYGPGILDALTQFQKGSRATGTPTMNPRPRPREETIQLLAEGRTFAEIAQIRGRHVSSVIRFTAELIEKGAVDFQPSWVESSKQLLIQAACARVGLDRVWPVKEAVPPEITYQEVRLVVARLRRQQPQKRMAAASGRNS